LRDIQPAGNSQLRLTIQRRLDHLTKPAGSLGRLEELALQYGLARGSAELKLARKAMFIFCADHGVAAEGVSAYPSAVTAQMARNFVRGGAAINVLCRQCGIDPRIVDVGVNTDFEPDLPILARKIGRGTQNFLKGPAMSEAQALASVEAGILLAREAAGQGYDILGAGEMGIGNTTAATAMLACFSGRDAGQLTGRGTGITDAQLARKAEVVRQSLALHRPDPGDPMQVLAAVGGFEIGAIAGLIFGAAAAKVPVAVDGFIASVGALAACRRQPSVLPYLFFSHLSAERGHAAALELMGARPLLALELRLGEGTGAALAISLIESAARLFTEMATFESAGVSQQIRSDPAASGATGKTA